MSVFEDAKYFVKKWQKKSSEIYAFLREMTTIVMKHRTKASHVVSFNIHLKCHKFLMKIKHTTTKKQTETCSNQ